MVLIQWEGPVTDPVGYATVAREFLFALDKLGVNCYLPQGVQGWTDVKKLDKEFIKLFKKLSKKPQSNKKSITIHFRLPFHHQKKSNEIIMTIFETNRIPHQWVKMCNNYFRETWVPNEFNMKTFRDSGVKKLYKVPYGVNLDRYNPNIEELKLENRFKFLSMFDFSYRKNPHGLINAYYKAFNYDDDVVLYVKTWNIPVIQFKDYIKKVQKGYKNKKRFPKIIIIPSVISDSNIARLLKTVDIHVMPSYGEGWSMPCIQSMACGTPSIATSWGGQMEFLTNKNSFLIAVKSLIPVKVSHHLWYHSYMQWANPNINHLSYLMRYCYEHPKEVRKKSNQGIRDVKKWTWENAAKIMVKRCEELCN
ncbi:hypothetical protein DRH29_02770 [candidate division Kazan bacterium]|uniref:Glycosyl transferase family 1 domain-containing protein n=1 Tax=candidate division Kazan bacterium TaxID=2202143 RepID=A0A420ZCE8_UNCK3|nr:MAG: hypothetical protein DRH29_02770 [candidate division Kazan bacterium]